MWVLPALQWSISENSAAELKWFLVHYMIMMSKSDEHLQNTTMSIWTNHEGAFRQSKVLSNYAWQPEAVRLPTPATSLLTMLDARHSFKSLISFFVSLIIISTLKHVSNNMGGRKLYLFLKYLILCPVIVNIICSMQQLNGEASLSSVASKKHGYVWEDKLELLLKVCFGVTWPFFLQVILLIRWNSCFIEYWHEIRSYALERANGWSVSRWELTMHWHESHDTVPGVR
jgi:hypothetical protein